MILATYIQGIPCRVRVTHYFHQAAMGYWADSPDDAYGYTEIDFDVLDGRGRKAPWIEARMMSEDTRAIEQEIIAAKEAEKLAFDEWGAYA